MNSSGSPQIKRWMSIGAVTVAVLGLGWSVSILSVNINIDFSDIFSDIEDDETPFLTPTPAVSPSPSTVIAEIVIHGNNYDGELYTVPNTGTYQIAVITGAYTTWPDSSLWRTRIYVYRDPPSRIPECGPYREPCNPDYRVGAPNDFDDYTAAQKAGQTASVVTTSLQAGTVLLFLAVDDRGSYEDNPDDAVTVQIRSAP